MRSASCTAGEASRPRQIDQIRPVSRTARSTAASCSNVVTPGLSTITSLPRCIAAIASSARSQGRAAITTKSIEGSSSSRFVSDAGTCGKRLRKPASTRGSVVSGL